MCLLKTKKTLAERNEVTKPSPSGPLGRATARMLKKHSQRLAWPPRRLGAREEDAAAQEDGAHGNGDC